MHLSLSCTMDLYICFHSIGQIHFGKCPCMIEIIYKYNNTYIRNTCLFSLTETMLTSMILGSTGFDFGTYDPPYTNRQFSLNTSLYKIGLLWCHSHNELTLIEVEVNLSAISKLHMELNLTLLLWLITFNMQDFYFANFLIFLLLVII